MSKFVTIHIDSERVEESINSVLSQVTLKPILNNIEEKISQKIIDYYKKENNKVINDFMDYIKKINKNLISNRVPNISVRIEEITVTKKINAEDHVINILKNDGFEIVGRYKDVINKINTTTNPDLNNIVYNESHIGRPDLLVVGNGDFFFVEVKTGADGLRVEQIEWIKKHPHIDVFIFYIKQNIKKEVNQIES